MCLIGVLSALEKTWQYRLGASSWLLMLFPSWCCQEDRPGCACDGHDALPLVWLYLGVVWCGVVWHAAVDALLRSTGQSNTT
jgi:hypothetical protein